MVVNNPNNWHWVDKNCIDWSKKYFKEKLPGVSASQPDQSIKITEVKSIEGDVEVCQRKGKVISLFDLKLVLGFEGHVTGIKDGESSKIDTSGSITIPELAYDTDEDELQFNISISNDSADTEKIKPLIRKHLEPKLRKSLIKFGSDLIATHGNDIQLPEEQVKSTFTKENQQKSNTGGFEKTNVTSTTSINGKTVTKTPATTSGSSGSVPKYNTSSLHLESSFTTTAEQLYMTFLEKDRIAAWTRGPPNLENKVGGKYSLFNGNIEGTILALEPNKRIEMSWRLKEWKEGHFANLDIKLHQLESETKAEIFFTGIPIGEEENVEDNFNDYYIKSIKVTFGFGIVL